MRPTKSTRPHEVDEVDDVDEVDADEVDDVGQCRRSRSCRRSWNNAAKRAGNGAESLAGSRMNLIKQYRLRHVVYEAVEVE
jgi:hypothetical protein